VGGAASPRIVANFAGARHRRGRDAARRAARDAASHIEQCLLQSAALIAQIFMSLASGLVSGLIHYYVWRRMVRDPAWPARPRRLATRAMVALFFAIPATMWSARLGYGGLATGLGWVAYPWMVAVGLTAVWLAMMDAARLVARLALRLKRRGATPAAVATPAAATPATAALAVDDAEPASFDRRIFLARAAAGTALVASAASISAGMVSARGEHEIVTVEVPIARLPRAFDGFSIVQLTDLHVGVTIDAEFVRRVVARTNEQKPDMIVLTGDLVDGTVENLRDDAAPLAGLTAPHGVFAVTGNHEYYSGADAWIAELTRLGFRYLRNERVAIEKDGARFDLAGIDDHSAHRWAGHGADLDKAMAGRDPSRALVLLAHQPRQVRVACDYDVDLQLSGHTHGGQIWPWHYIVKVQQGGLLAGMYREKKTALYVSRGCGYFGPPVRVGAPLEITRIVLRAV
jgi:uncharacterized protein